MSNTHPSFDFHTQSGGDLIETAARTLYETDEDMTDEAISALTAAGNSSWQEKRCPRLGWDELDPALRDAYRRRIRAILALLDNWKH